MEADDSLWRPLKGIAERKRKNVPVKTKIKSLKSTVQFAFVIVTLKRIGAQC